MTTDRAAIKAYSPITCSMQIIGFVDREGGKYQVRIFEIPLDEMDEFEFRCWAREAGESCAWKIDWYWQPVTCLDRDEEPYDWTGELADWTGERA